MNMDYFYTKQDVEQYSGQDDYFCIPKILFESPEFITLSTEAKLLYALMLSRMIVALENGIVDEQNRGYITYSLPEIMSDLHCGRNKCRRLMNTLEMAGLIRVIPNCNNPRIIYVMKVSESATNDPEDQNNNPGGHGDRSGGGQNEPSEETGLSSKGVQNEPTEDTCLPNEGSKMNPDAHGKLESGAKKAPNECGNTDGQGVQNGTASRARADKDRLDKLNTNISIYQSINHESKSTDTVSLTYTPDPDSDDKPTTVHETPGDYKVYFANQFELNKRSQDSDHAEDVPLMAEVVSFCAELTSQCDHSATVHIGRRIFPSAEIKRRFMGLTTAELDYFLDCFSSVRTDVRNPKAYILTSLYNAPETIETYKFRKRRRRTEVLPAYYYDSGIDPEGPEDGKPIDRAALMAGMRAAATA